MFKFVRVVAVAAICGVVVFSGGDATSAQAGAEVDAANADLAPGDPPHPIVSEDLCTICHIPVPDESPLVDELVSFDSLRAAKAP